MKKKQTKLVFTKEIRAFFRERELRRVAELKAEIQKLKDQNTRLFYESSKAIERSNHIKAQFKEFYNKVFS